MDGMNRGIAPNNRPPSSSSPDLTTRDLAPAPSSHPEAHIHVVYVENDERLAKQTARYLESHNLSVVIASDGIEGIAVIMRERPDIVLLDAMLPTMNGFDVCLQLRARIDAPILMVSARDEEADRVLLLEGGADDYILKPFSPRELLARIRAHARRARGQIGPARELRIGPIVVDRAAMRATFRSSPLVLTTYEFLLLRTLAERAGRVVKREQVVDAVRGSADEAFDRSVDIHISHLRAKLGDDPRNPRLIKTVRGVGYMLAEVDD
jgi:DNA-binding response OmpR family regulator